MLRYPEAIRPWQHVLDCLWGYLTLLGAVQGSNERGAWNFGPGRQASLSVRQVAEISSDELGVALTIQGKAGVQFVEDQYLVLDSNKAETSLGWKNRIKDVEAISMSLLPLGRVSREKMVADVEEFLSRPSR